MANPAEPPAKAGEQGCRHYWVIESPNGPTSLGTCKWCGQLREFRNSFPTSGWERDHHEASRHRITLNNPSTAF